MITYSIYATPKDNCTTVTIANETQIISVTNHTLRVVIIDQAEVKVARYIDISPERFNKLVQKVTRKILCTL